MSPPYDVITPEQHARLHTRNEYNVVRLIEPSGESPAKYTNAAEQLGAWLREGILVREDAPALYVYEQRYRTGDAEHVQRGVIGAVSLDEDSILPHEKTMAAPVEDRLALMRATEANLEPIICVYRGAEGVARNVIAEASMGEAAARFDDDDGVSNAVFVMRDREAISAVRSSLATTRLVIADGHHRHRTAQVYRDERRAAGGPGPWDAMMILALDEDWSGPSVLPIHRVVSGVDAGQALAALSAAFEIEEAKRSEVSVLEAELAARRRAERCYVLLDRSRAWWLTLRDTESAEAAMPPDRSPDWRDLDVAVLHSFIFERLLGVTPSYVHSAAEAVEALDLGNASVAFLLAATPFDAVRRIAERGEAMPPKSTYFFPKPRSGVVMRLLDE